MNDIGGKEQRFLDALEFLFTGAQVDGQSGFINLMRVKRRYFQSLRPQLLAAIDNRARPQTAAREELFDKLYTFFGRYFCESGSIYFRHLPAFAPTYQQVYADGQDVALSWKTQDLYYVKSDTLIRSMPITLEHPTSPDKNLHFYFDAGQLQHKQNNEKREILFQFQQTKHGADGPVLHLEVHYSQKGRKTNLESILKQARQAQPRIRLSEEQLQKACRIFRRQTEADFFIHKDARAFLKEQFDLWMYQYLFGQEETIFQEKRIQQLQAIQQTAYDIIDWIAQFEDELRRIWEKPKFVRNVNYVITLDKLPGTLLEKLAQHQGSVDQTQEWKELGMVEESFHFEDLLKPNLQHKHLPLDTKHFPSMRLEILATLGNLDEVLDGELVHSENWQALNTLRKRYKEKVKTIYIDPPFNLDGSDQFDYRTNYKDSCWATLLENRLALARTLLSGTGSIFVRCDYNGNWIVHRLMDEVFNQELINEIQVNTTQKVFEGVHGYNIATNSLFWYGKTRKTYISPQRIKRDNIYWLECHSGGEQKPPERTFFGKVLLPPKGRHWTFIQEKINKMIENGRIRANEKKEYVDMNGKSIKGMPEYQISAEKLLTSNWTDIPGYASTVGFQTENSEKLLDRVIRTASNKTDVVMDFFLGSGTTTAVAQKLGGQEVAWH